MIELPIYFRDLKEDAKKEVLDFLGMTNEKEDNWDLVPLTILVRPDK